jgi:beta-lactamase regulating signal transducer with metallopeptidase domain
VVLESALRSLMMALTAWAALRLLRVSHVIAQKIAWALVLVAAIAMPLLMRWPTLKIPAAIELPAYRLRAALPEVSPAAARPAVTAPALHAVTVAPIITSQSTVTAAPTTTVQIMPAAMRENAAPVASWSLAQLWPLAQRAYLAVVCLLLLRVLFGLILAMRVWRRALLASALIEPRATVRVSSEISSPVTIGSGIVLPASFPEWGQAKLRVVLAHERSHVRQADFYLQLAARLHTAIFWFSPLAWWLQKELSDLGEAISDRAGLEESANRHSYAELLLEFAAMPRRSLVGVAMARSSRIERRIDRLLSDSLFRRAFVQGKRHAFVAAAIVPLAVIASTSLVTVRAAETATRMSSQGVISQPARLVFREIAPAAVLRPELRAQATPPQQDVAAPLSPTAPDALGEPLAPVAPEAGMAPVAPPAIPQAAAPPAPPMHERGRWRGDRDGFAIVSGDSEHAMMFNTDSEEIAKAKAKLHGSYILFERDGKSYFIDDAAMVAESQRLMKPMDELDRQQEALGAQQEVLGKEQERLGRMQEQASVPTPDMSREIAELETALKKLQELHQGQNLKQEDLAEIQGKIGDLQGHLGSIEGQLGEQQGKFGEQQGLLGEKQGKLGEQQGRLGEQQGRLAEEVSRKVKAMIDQAVRDGKTKPVE